MFDMLNCTMSILWDLSSGNTHPCKTQCIFARINNTLSHTASNLRLLKSRSCIPRCISGTCLLQGQSMVEL